MPELPEVETIRRELHPHLVGQTIQRCEILRNDIVAYPSPRTLCHLAVGETIICVSREAKYLIIGLTNHKRLIFHLRLSGTLSLQQFNAPLERFTRVFFVTNNYRLMFNEPRALGRVYLLKENSRKGVPKGLSTLGREPIAHEFDLDYFRNKLKGRKARIKSLLLDQRICAGVGNIYSDEALFHAGIRPLRRAYTITKAETFRLLRCLKDVLNRAIDNFGTSVGDYTRTDGDDGNFQKFLHVYGREGELCRICGTPIKVVKLGNRSSRYCPVCQK